MGKQENKRTVKTALLNTIANVLSLIVGAIMIPLITRVMSSSDIGIAATFISNRNILVIIVTLAVYGFIHKAMLEFSSEKVDYIYSISLFCIAIVALVFIICIPFKEILQRALSLDDFLYYWLFISVLVFALYTIGDHYCIFHNKAIVVFFIVLCTGPVSQVLSIILSYFLPENKYIGRVLGLDATYCVVAIILLIWLMLSGKHNFRKKYVVETLRFTIPIIPHMLSQMVLTQCDLIMITYFAGSDKSGIYSMGHTVGFLAFTVMSQIMSIWSPWVYRRLEEKNVKGIYNNANYMVLLGMYLTMGLITVSPELIKIFLTEEYIQCIYIIPPLAVAMFLQFIYIFFYDLEYYYKKPHWIAIASVFTAVLNLVLNFIFIPRCGYMAAAYTTLVSYFVLMVFNFIFAQKLGGCSVYNIPVFAIVIVAVVVYMIIMFAITDWLIIRYLLLVAITIVLFLKENKNIRMLIASLKG